MKCGLSHLGGQCLFQDLLDRIHTGTATSCHQQFLPEILDGFGAIGDGPLEFAFGNGVTYTDIHE